ncbi:metallophosphoesterase [Desulfococcaceae bacterium HSG9]|nr:metallophosphoesterase [Desulfococcaceae bacterium HSG9]
MKTVISIGYPILVLGVFAWSIWYISFRLRILFGLKKKWPLLLAVSLYFIVSLIPMFSSADSISTTTGLLNIAGGYFFTFYLFTLLLLLVLHIVQLKWTLNGKKAAISTMLLSLMVTVGGALWANQFTVNIVEIELAGLKQDVKVMHLSDIHIGHHRGKEYLTRIVVETNRLKPDVVLLNGDLVDSNVALLPGTLSALADFDAPVFFTGGNHDNYVNTERLFEIITQHGVRILHNEIVDFAGIYWIGLDYMKPDNETFDMHPSKDKRTIKEILPQIPLKEDKPSVLIHHSPVGIKYISERGIDLMLSGHTHAGQIFPGTLIMSVFFPFNKGLHKKDDLQVFTSQGAGTYGPRVRIGTSNEINFLHLKVAKLRDI